MRHETDSEYSVRRQAAERMAAARSNDPVVRQIHETLADYHAGGADRRDPPLQQVNP